MEMFNNKSGLLYKVSRAWSPAVRATLISKRDYFMKTLKTKKIGFASIAGVFVAVTGVGAWQAFNVHSMSSLSPTPPANNSAPSNISHSSLPQTVTSQQSLSTDVSSSTSSTNGTSTNVTVNGQNVPVPTNGAIHKTVRTSNGGTATVDIQSQSNTSDSKGNSHSFQSVQVSGDTSTDISNSTRVTHQ